MTPAATDPYGAPASPMPLVALPTPAPAERRLVYLPGTDTAWHERETHRSLLRQLGQLLDMPFDNPEAAAEPGPAATAIAPGSAYVVPARTLEGPGAAQALGIRSEADFFGGCVPLPFIGSKVISHGLVHPDAVAPAGWQHGLAERMQGCVLRGHSAFSLDDARRAAQDLLAQGPVRLKAAGARGGLGQAVVRDLAGFEAFAAGLRDEAHWAEGLVLEEDLAGADTFSIGQCRFPGTTLSYYGTQCTTADNRGRQVYGGSTLHVVQGGFEVLSALPGLADEVREAVRRARAYDAAASEAFPGLLASRRNYDLVAGSDSQGRRRIGVLEQSWRLGGASGAEILALAAFLRGGARGAVTTTCVERFGPLSDPLPPGATVLCRGEDPEVGPITKYALRLGA